jgi:hypothetical protein
MPKLRLLILDANVVITLHERGIWAEVIGRCDVHLARTVVREAHFVDDDEGDPLAIDLSTDESNKRITVFDVDVDRVREFERSFDANYAAGLHAGEKESLAHLEESAEDYLMCSGDQIVYKILGNLGRGDQGISVEEVLKAIGLSANLGWNSTKKFRDRYTAEGQTDSIYGKGRKPAQGAP